MEQVFHPAGKLVYYCKMRIIYLAAILFGGFSNMAI